MESEHDVHLSKLSIDLESEMLDGKDPFEGAEPAHSEYEDYGPMDGGEILKYWHRQAVAVVCCGPKAAVDWIRSQVKQATEDQPRTQMIQIRPAQTVLIWRPLPVL
jgi:hypothetical protein